MFSDGSSNATPRQTSARIWSSRPGSSRPSRPVRDGPAGWIGRRVGSRRSCPSDIPERTSPLLDLGDADRADDAESNLPCPWVGGASPAKPVRSARAAHPTDRSLRAVCRRPLRPCVAEGRTFRRLRTRPVTIRFRNADWWASPQAMMAGRTPGFAGSMRSLNGETLVNAPSNHLAPDPHDSRHWSRHRARRDGPRASVKARGSAIPP